MPKFLSKYIRQPDWVGQQEQRRSDLPWTTEQRLPRRQSNRNAETHWNSAEEFPWMKNPRYFLKDWKQSRKRFQPALFFGEESSWMERIIRLENLQPKKHQLGAVNHPSCSINSGIHWSVWMVEWVLEMPNWGLLVFSKHKVVFLLSLSPYFCSKIYLKISFKLTVKILCVDIIKPFPLIWVWFCFPLAQLLIGIFKILIFQSLLRWIIFFLSMFSQERKIIAA